MPPAAVLSWIWSRGEGRRRQRGTSTNSLLSGWAARWRICPMGEHTHHCGQCLILIPTIHDSGACTHGRKRPLRCWPLCLVSGDCGISWENENCKCHGSNVRLRYVFRFNPLNIFLMVTLYGTLAYSMCICCIFCRTTLNQADKKKKSGWLQVHGVCPDTQCSSWHSFHTLQLSARLLWACSS